VSQFARALAGRRVAVLGATGFIGRWVAREASRAGAEVWLVVRDEAAAAGIAASYGIQARIARVDVRQAADLAAFYRDVRPELTCNLAGYGVDRRESDPALAEAINVDLVRRLLDLVPAAAAGSDWPGLHLVHTGSPRRRRRRASHHGLRPDQARGDAPRRGGGGGRHPAGGHCTALHRVWTGRARRTAPAVYSGRQVLD
jgi:nucleoside-diphosphate-sugar epimerase